MILAMFPAMFPTIALADPSGEAAEVLARFAAEPGVAEVQRWAAAAARASPGQVDRWLRRSSSFAALPEVTVDLRLRTDWDQGYGYLAPNGAEPLPSDSDVVAVPDDIGTGLTREARLRLRWQLGDLVMSSERIRVIDEAQDLAKLRDKALTEVTRLYFERRRLQVQRELAPRVDPMAEIDDELRMLELTAGIDALTGGAFSRALAAQR